MEKIWLKSYPPGVPAEINPDTYESLPHLLEEAFQKHANRPFAVCMERWMSYREVDILSAALAAWLQNQGLEPGARVAIMLPNLPQFSVTMAAILRAGYTCVNVNPLYTPRELEHQLNDSGAETIIILENFASTLLEVMSKTPIKRVVLTRVGDLLGAIFGKWITFAVRHLKKAVPAYTFTMESGLQVTAFNDAISHGRRLPLKPHSTNLQSTAFLQYTGGTTGLSKGAVLTHRNIVAAVLQGEAWFSPALNKIGDVRNINSIAALPLYHIFALNLSLLSIRMGAFMTLVPNPRDFPGFVKTLQKRPFHMLPAVNTLFNALLQQPQFKSIDFSALYISQAGGMAASEGTARNWLEVTGCPMIEGWGMSETVAIGTNNPVNNKEFTGTIGLPLPSISIAIKNEAGEDVPQGASGEICIKGPNVMKGYLNLPEKTSQVIRDGWYVTGDVARMDEEGFIMITDRLSRFSKIAGEMVPHIKVETKIHEVLGVSEQTCVVTSVPDDKRGERLVVLCLSSVDLVALEVDERLVMQLEVVGLDGVPQIAFEADAIELARVHVGIKHLVP